MKFNFLQINKSCSLIYFICTKEGFQMILKLLTLEVISTYLLRSEFKFPFFQHEFLQCEKWLPIKYNIVLRKG